MKNKVLFVINSSIGSSRNFLDHLIGLINEDWSVDVLSIKDKFENSDKINVRELNESSYLDTKFWQGFFKCIKRNKWKYIPILIKEKITKKTDLLQRISKVKLEGRYKACVSVDLESCAYVANNVIARTKILRFPYSRVEEPYAEDFAAINKFNYVVCPDENIIKSFSDTYKYDLDKIRFIPNSICKDELIEKSKAYNVEKNNKYIITSFCRLASLNQIDLVIDTVKKMIDNNFKDFLWHVVSGTSDITKINIKLEKLGLDKYINFMPKQENPYPYLKICNVYAHVSDIKGENVSLKEANVLEKPSVIINKEKDTKKFSEDIIKMCENPTIVKFDGTDNMGEAYIKLFNREENL